MLLTISRPDKDSINVAWDSFKSRWDGFWISNVHSWTRMAPVLTSFEEVRFPIDPRKRSLNPWRKSIPVLIDGSRVARCNWIFSQLPVDSPFESVAVSLQGGQHWIHRAILAEIFITIWSRTGRVGSCGEEDWWCCRWFVLPLLSIERLDRLHIILVQCDFALIPSVEGSH